ncbi:MAG: 2-succinyl-6-hydroxy-2,4-cyclohexadiene-1-carboxylate synthase [Anaerolineales bacterium]|nr:2-succinyl-6-hydroxy-2,4-cyclohexadiene-1-carboxylate synthase [Anaerolineales bacterium]
MEINGQTFNLETAGDGAPLVLLHGFTGSAANWHPHVSVFSRHFRTMAIDLLGHGASASPPEAARYSMTHCTADVNGILTALQVDSAAVLGYSLGGRVALSFAINYPERVSHLLMVSGSPGLASAEERATRVASDEALASQIERDGLEAFVDYWENIPLFASQKGLPAAVRAALRQQRLQNNAHGLANNLRGLGAGAQPSLWERLHEVTVPTLLLAGERDTKFVNIARQMATRLPNARLEIVPGAGHAVQLEKPGFFQNSVLNFLSGIRG